MKNDLFLNALLCKNTGSRPPVWLMRQAGRYLPQYQECKKTRTLNELFNDPKSIVEVTKMPVDILGVDAAILFADILHIVKPLGFEVVFSPTGPQIHPKLENPKEIDNITIQNIPEIFAFLRSSIETLKIELHVPLIGFCGGPFTVASYILECGHKGMLMKTKEWLYSYPEQFHKLLQKITDASIEYLKLQIKAGVDAIQIFDSWAGSLAKEEFKLFVLPYIKQILSQVKEIPVIIFCRGASLFAKEIANLAPQGMSLDWQIPLYEMRQFVSKNIALQGNFDPILLKAPFVVIEKQVRALVRRMRGDPGFIVNLGHGVLPHISVEAVKCFVNAVKG